MIFKYYHGTSSIFLDSIIKHGLGGINPNFEYKNLEVLGYLRTLAEKHLIKIPRYLNLRAPLLAMVNQTGLEVSLANGQKTVLNYRHDGMYVAITREKAAIYAIHNSYGSEILEYCIILYKMLRKHNVEFEIPEKINLFKIETYLDYKHKPILIEINGVLDNELEMENGGSASEYLQKLRIMILNMSEKDKFEQLQNFNCKLKKTIPFERMKFYKLEFDNYTDLANVDWTMTLINFKK